MPEARIRILPNDQHPNIRKSVGERPNTFSPEGGSAPAATFAIEEITSFAITPATGARAVAHPESMDPV
jgi:hypothetical protein